MKKLIIMAVSVAAVVASCGPGPQNPPPPVSGVEAEKARDSLPRYDSTGVIVALDGMMITLDHDGASAAGLPAGRNEFIVYGDVLAEAPVTPGARVSFRFIRTVQGLELTDLKAR